MSYSNEYYFFIVMVLEKHAKENVLVAGYVIFFLHQRHFEITFHENDINLNIKL